MAHKVESNLIARRKKDRKKRGGNTAGEFLRGVAFCTGKEGSKHYGKTVEHLGLYVSTQFKNGSDVMKCLLNEKVVKLEVPELGRTTQPTRSMEV